MRLQHYLASNPDFRRQPKTDVFCWRCQKDLGSDQPKRWVAFTADGESIIHPDDMPADAEWQADLANTMGVFPVGMDCARKIGLEWTTP